MAYTQANYTVFNPREEILPYLTAYNKDYDTEEEKYNKFLEQLYAAPEILKRDQDYVELNNSIENNKEKIANLIANNSGTVADIKNIGRQLYQDWAKYSNGIKRAKILSDFISERNKGGSEVLYDNVLDANTKVNDVDENFSYTTQKASTYRALGAKIGQVELYKNPEAVNKLFGNIGVISQGASYKDLLDALEDEDSSLSQAIADIRSRSGITHPEEVEKRDRAIFEGLVSALDRKYSTQKLNTGRTTSGGGGGRGGSKDFQVNLQQAVNDSVTEDGDIDFDYEGFAESIPGAEVIQDPNSGEPIIHYKNDYYRVTDQGIVIKRTEPQYRADIKQDSPETRQKAEEKEIKANYKEDTGYDADAIITDNDGKIYCFTYTQKQFKLNETNYAVIRYPIIYRYFPASNNTRSGTQQISYKDPMYDRLASTHITIVSASSANDIDALQTVKNGKLVARKVDPNSKKQEQNSEEQGGRSLRR